MVNGDYKYKIIARKIENKIFNDEYNEGKRIDSLKSLSRKFNVHYQTIDSAIDYLEKQDFLYRVRNVGVFVSDGAKEKVIKKRKKQFDKELNDLIDEAAELNIDLEKRLSELINN